MGVTNSNKVVNTSQIDCDGTLRRAEGELLFAAAGVDFLPKTSYNFTTRNESEDFHGG